MSKKFHQLTKNERRKFVDPFIKCLFMYFHAMDPKKHTKAYLCRKMNIPSATAAGWYQDVFERMWCSIRHWNGNNPELAKKTEDTNIKSPDDLRFIWQLQQWYLGGPCCYITGEELVLEWPRPDPLTRKGNIPPNGISKDRVESNIGYTRTNTKFSAHWINVKKRDLDIEILDMLSSKMKKLKKYKEEGRVGFSAGGRVGG